MANVCENSMYVSSEDVRNLEHIRSYMGNWAYAQIENIDDETFEVYFDSKWDFPFVEMNEMVENLPNKDDIYIRVLSIEYGEYYCAFHVYDGDSWECM
jgi:hypothetical protein